LTAPSIRGTVRYMNTKARYNIFLNGQLIGTQVSTSALRACQVFASRKRLDYRDLTATAQE